MESSHHIALRLSPVGGLVVDRRSDLSADLEGPLGRFAGNWCEGWFHLAADRCSLHHPVLRYWQEIAKEYLTMLCHLPEEEEFCSLPVPDSDQLSRWLQSAPPMVGGEYLSLVRLGAMWKELNLWVEQMAREGIHSFLSERAPKWQQVGRVCFHLKEER